MRRALDNEEFVLHYQPKVDLKTRRIEGFEALIRWMSPDFGLVMPGRIISLLEETGLILEIGTWALYRAAIDRRFWLDQNIDAPRIAVNISGVQLRQPDFVSTVAGALKAGAAPSGIDVEITESLLMEDIEVNLDKLDALQAIGVNLSIDDFGTGYSSLAYLAKMPAKILKINRIPVADQATSGEHNTTFVTDVISLAHSLKMEVVAKGVEKAEEARLLRRLHCDQIQGYLISPPAPFEEITALLGSSQKRILKHAKRAIRP